MPRDTSSVLPRRAVEHTNAGIFSANESADIGVDEATRVTEAYQEGENMFTGTIYQVTIDLK